MREITSAQLVEKLRVMRDDPLTVLFVDEWKIGNRIVRLNHGDVQWRYLEARSFSFGMSIKEFLTEAEPLLRSHLTMRAADPPSTCQACAFPRMGMSL